MLIPPQDKAELFRLAFMAGTKQEQLEALEAPDNAFPFHAAAAAKPQPCSRAPTEAAAKGRAPQKWRGGQGQRGRRDFQRFKDFNAEVLMKVNMTLLCFLLLKRDSL